MTIVKVKWRSADIRKHRWYFTEPTPTNPMMSLKSESSYKNSESWTDDLPVCKSTGIGFSTNQIYRKDGHPQEDHPYEDCSSHFRFNDHFYWYALFDGHRGKRAAEFCSQRMTAEIYFSQLDELNTDEEVKELLRQAFTTVEKGYMESLGDLLAERTSLHYDIPEGLNSYEAYQKVPQVMEAIQRINCELSSGTVVAVALIFKNKLYVANVGNCRVLLCQTDPNSVLKVVQLSVDHDVTNEDELLRLSQIGIDTKQFNHRSHIGNQETTRCLGNHTIKEGYRNFEDISMATQEPIIAEPDVHGGIVLDESCRFLILMTAGLYRCVEEAIGTDQVNKYIAQCIVEQFREQSTLTGVAQAVVDKVVRLHHDWYMSNTASGMPKREDITLVLRNFNFPLPNAAKSPAASFATPTGLSSNSGTATLTKRDTPIGTGTGGDGTDTTTSSERVEVDQSVGPDQKIKAYVDFAQFYENLEIAKRMGPLPGFTNF
ncbi:TGF-beta-activated kinase 1 and MAP3K7-binding protein 1-like [Cylas formicarius]|uniref:TGF-beta-activated kinase 1 and MAP3K7-binding protein 1-like n=1 Tax=Cylas formicarius TaxID=197179 RepID=UPI0029587160|nr:TGF-beta-activated kinase 1 and MAP3K7-binding protein 1-like [Cylas formicarius]